VFSPLGRSFRNVPRVFTTRAAVPVTCHVCSPRGGRIFGHVPRVFTTGPQLRHVPRVFTTWATAATCVHHVGRSFSGPLLPSGTDTRAYPTL